MPPFVDGRDCVRGANLAVPAWAAISFWYNAFPLYPFSMVQIHSMLTQIGRGNFDLTFIDHSNNFQECSRPFGDDIVNAEGSFFQSNLSLCEEKQYEDQVLQPEWSWRGAKYMDLYMFNVTNPATAAGGGLLEIQELAPLFLSSQSNGGDSTGTVTVNPSDLDEHGRLTYKVARTWRYRKELLKYQRTSLSDAVTVPHYIFAAALHNGMGVGDLVSPDARVAFTSKGLPAQYPLFVNVKISSLLGLSAYDPIDPVSEDQADAPFTIDMFDSEPSDTSYFVSLRHGLQGFGFIRYAWNGQDIHCGYDLDCGDSTTLSARAKRFQLNKAKAIVTSRSCSGLPEACQPTSLKHANNGVQFGVSSLKHLPSGSFFDIPEVTGDLWNYKDYSKQGTVWTGLKAEYFLLYDVKLEKEARFMRVPVHHWSLDKIHRRTENCEGGGGDAVGVDCTGSPATAFIGSVRDALRPGPLYFSQAESAPPADEKKRITTCEKGHSDILECQRPLKNNFQLLTDAMRGSKVCHRESAQVSLKLQKSTAFQNNDPMVPLAWKKDHVCLTGGKMFELMRLETILPGRVSSTTLFWVLQLMWWGIVVAHSTRAAIISRRIDLTNYLSDKPCV